MRPEAQLRPRRGQNFVNGVHLDPGAARSSNFVLAEAPTVPQKEPPWGPNLVNGAPLDPGAARSCNLRRIARPSGLGGRTLVYRIIRKRHDTQILGFGYHALPG